MEWSRVEARLDALSIVVLHVYLGKAASSRICSVLDL